MTEKDLHEATIAPAECPPRRFPVRRAAFAVAAGAIAGALVFFHDSQAGLRDRTQFELVAIATYAAVVMGVAGLACALVLRATWWFSWGPGARGVLMMVVGATAGMAGGLHTVWRVFPDTSQFLSRSGATVIGTILFAIIWTIGGTARRLPQPPQGTDGRMRKLKHIAPKLTPWQRWGRDLVSTVIAVIAIDGALTAVDAWKPPTPVHGLGNWGPRLSPHEELMTSVLFFAVISAVLAATIFGGMQVIRRLVNSARFAISRRIEPQCPDRDRAA
jgi:hypothetical protein